VGERILFDQKKLYQLDSYMVKAKQNKKQLPHTKNQKIKNLQINHKPKYKR
jgi:hypothetical protein